MSIPRILSEKQYDDALPGSVVARQGDVLLYKPHTTPVPGKQIENGGRRVVLAHGEVTGHAHAFYRNEATAPKSAYELYEIDAPKFCHTTLPGQFLRLNERSFLRHEEHDPLSLPARDYISVIQHEGNEIGEIRRVAD